MDFLIERVIQNKPWQKKKKVVYCFLNLHLMIMKSYEELLDRTFPLLLLMYRTILGEVFELRATQYFINQENAITNSQFEYTFRLQIKYQRKVLQTEDSILFSVLL